MNLKKIRLGRAAEESLRTALAGGTKFTTIRFGRVEDLSAGELVEAETASRERFLLKVEECRSFPIEEIPEEYAREAGFVSGFSLQFVMRNLAITEVTVTRFTVVKYIEYDF